MRLIGYLASESSARSFGDYLYVQGIENQIDHEPPDGWGVWIADEDRIERAASLFAAFCQNPADSKFRAQARGAAELREAKARDEAAWRKKLQDRRQLFRPLAAYGFGPLTFVLITASVAVFLWSKLGTERDPIMSLFITDFSDSWDPTLPEIRHGQIWRLFTPIFIHFNLLHLFFNMLWLRDLGSMIEARQSSWYLAGLVAAIAACSNLGQVWIGHSPLFGGMSGVVYGLLGYVWIRGKFDPGSGLFLHQSTVTMMIIWFVLCFTGILGPIANTAHAVGLVMGMTWGYLSSLRYR